MGERGRIRAERIQVGDHQVDRLDAVGFHVGQVIDLGPVGQDPAVQLGMQGHHPVSEDGREPGEGLGVGHGQAGVAQGSGRTSTGHEVPAQVGQARG
jgi:hypothetical protein